MGSGQFANAGVPVTGGLPVGAAGSDVTLDFTNVDIRDVLRSVLGDLLKLPYTIDPAVQGTVTLQTGRPIPRSSVIDVLNTALQLSGVAIVANGGLYLAVPVANAGRQAPLGGGNGFVTRIVPLQYVPAGDLERALEPLVPPGTTVKSDPARNLLIVSGPLPDVTRVQENITTFDVDFLRGVSFALLPLHNGKARDVAADVTKLLTASGRSVSDMVKVVPIDRMNAVLVTSLQPAYISRVKDWVDRFDRGDGHGDQQLFIYRVQNGRAADLARVLRQALGIAGTDANQGGGPPGGSSFDVEAPPPGAAAGATAGLDTVQNTLTPPVAAPAISPPQRSDPLAGVGAAAALGDNAGGPGGAASVAGAPATDIRVTADRTNNALIVTATPQEYAPIEAALEKLDITPLQVLIDATVAEVTLTNQLNLGLQYYINSGNFRAIFAPNVAPATTGTAATATGQTLDSTFPGLGFLSGLNLGYSSGGTNILLQALSSLTTVRVLSSPNLLVLNNGTARLQVGDQVPIATQSATSTLTNTAQTVNSINYRDTGVILSITPRVNASGLVLLDMSEEVSLAGNTSTSALNSPTISQRRVTSSMAINDGQTIALAGLIQENRTNSTSGLPWLKDLPVIGFLFGFRSDKVTRTELIVLITPHVIRSREDADAVTEELRQQLRLTIPVVARQR